MNDNVNALEQVLQNMWTNARVKNGYCHFCGNQLIEGEDFALCDPCWETTLPADDDMEDNK
jgi:hypothetical protein